MGADCDIRFENNPEKIVYGGQQVAGIIDINVNKVVRVRKLVLYIEGVGECEWRESTHRRNEYDRTEYTYYRGRDQYLNTITHLIPNEAEIQPGHHTYHFMFEVPLGAPSSVNEEYGSIYYRVRVVFDRPSTFDYEFKSDFVVIRPLDLNLEPELRIPVQEEEIKNFCCLFCASEKVILTVSIPQSGYIVGQKIPIKITINNPSTVDISHMEIKLMKHIKFVSQTPHSQTKSDDVRVHKMCHGSLFCEGKLDYDIEFEVPETVPSTNNPLVTVIKVHYDLTVKAKTPGCHMSPCVSFPITIGTVPIGAQSISYNNVANGFPLSAPIENGFSNCMMSPNAPHFPPTDNEFSDFNNPSLPPTSFQYPNVPVPLPVCFTSNDFSPVLTNFNYPKAPMLHTDVQLNYEFSPSAPTSFDYSNNSLSSNGAFRNNEFSPSAPSNFQYPNFQNFPANKEFSNTMVPPSVPGSFQYPNPLFSPNAPLNNMMAPSAPSSFQYSSAPTQTTPLQSSNEFLPSAPTNFHYPNAPIPQNNIESLPSAPCNNQVPNTMVPSAPLRTKSSNSPLPLNAVQSSNEFPSAPPFQYPNDNVALTSQANNEVPNTIAAPISENLKHPRTENLEASSNNGVSKSVTSQKVVPSAPFDPEMPPLSFEEASKLMHSESTDASAAHNNERPIGFIIPSNEDLKRDNHPTV